MGPTSKMFSESVPLLSTMMGAILGGEKTKGGIIPLGESSEGLLPMTLGEIGRMQLEAPTRHRLIVVGVQMWLYQMERLMPLIKHPIQDNIDIVENQMKGALNA